MCAFAAVTIILFSIVMLSGEGFFEGAVMWDAAKGTLTLFGTELVFDTGFVNTAQKLLSFNEVIFGKSFWLFTENVALFIKEYFSSFLAFAYNFAKAVVGAA